MYIYKVFFQTSKRKCVFVFRFEILYKKKFKLELYAQKTMKDIFHIEKINNKFEFHRNYQII